MQKWSRRLLVVEDDPLVALLLADLLRNSDFEVQTASNASEALDCIKKFDPDGALLDIHLGSGPSGLSLGQMIHRTNPEIALVFLTKYPDALKAESNSLSVPEGSTFLSKSLITDFEYLEEVIENAFSNKRTRVKNSEEQGPLSRLTRVQLEILRLVALGLTNTAIATHRKTKERTVEQRLQTIYSTLEIAHNPNVNQRVEAALIYISYAGMPHKEAVD